jgi:hypothetical protein
LKGWNVDEERSITWAEQLAWLRRGMVLVRDDWPRLTVMWLHYFPECPFCGERHRVV